MALALFWLNGNITIKKYDYYHKDPCSDRLLNCTFDSIDWRHKKKQNRFEKIIKKKTKVHRVQTRGVVRRRRRNKAGAIELYSHQRVRPFLLFNHNNNSNKNIKETSKQLTAGGDFTGGGRSLFFLLLLLHL